MSRLKIAFVASGGAARGIAHLGVLKACEELGVVPQIFVGASSGALVAATYGQDIPLDVLLDAYRFPWRRRHGGPRLHATSFLGAPRARDFLDLGYLLSGAFSIDRLEGELRRALPINDFRKLPNTVFITAVDVDTGQRVVFGPGFAEAVPVSEAVAASSCIPGLFRPFRIDGRYYVDGEIVRTLSADLAISAGANVILVSNVYRPEQSSPGGRSIARRGAGKMLRQSLSILLSEKERRGIELLTRTHPNVTFIEIAPDIGDIGYLNRFAARPLVLRGYRAALRVLAEAKERGVFDEDASDVTLN
jgi:NTE family protein